MTDYENFVEFVAKEIFDTNWNTNYKSFTEIACRKLYKLGLVDKDDKGFWILNEKIKSNYPFEVKEKVKPRSRKKCKRSKYRLPDNAYDRKAEVKE